MSTADPLFVETCQVWLAQTGELFVERYMPHSGGSGSYYAIQTRPQLEALIVDTAPGAVLFISRRQELPIRGVVDDALIEAALQRLPDGTYWVVMRPTEYPSELDLAADDDSSAALLVALRALRGQAVWVGPDLEFPNQYWDADDRDDVIIGRKPSHNQPVPLTPSN